MKVDGDWRNIVYNNVRLGRYKLKNETVNSSYSNKCINYLA